jgi:hypothetical protein
MLPEQGPEIADCDSQVWDVRRYPASGWHEVHRCLKIAFRKWRSTAMQKRTPPESRLAQMAIEVGLGVDGNWSADPTVLERLEAQVAATDDRAVRKVFAAYLSEP